MIRNFHPADTSSLLRIYTEASRVATPFLSEAFLEQECKNIREIYIPNTVSYIYDQQNRNMGFISMMGNEIGGLFVDPDYQGHGIGTRLLNHVRPEFEHLEVEVFEKNAIGRAFYDKMGFVQISQSVHEPTGEKLLRLKLDKAK